MDQQQAKQQIVDRVKQAENILVTVSANPTVDQLAACIGLTLLLNKMGKSATAVYSGKTPSVLEFLQPQKTLETNTDSLRDFIISLDKAKADKLRYKIEDQVVRIFITPYKTKLSEKDLIFGEGDFNVDVVVALGVLDRAHLDLAITAHGRILHDAAVIAVSAGAGKAPALGQINWQDTSASSLSEMLVSISEAFGENLIDNQIATAFLTGIVAETERFSNKKTSPKVMTMSAQLMAAGANQQLVISKLTPPPPPPPPPPPKPKAASPPLAAKKEAAAKPAKPAEPPKETKKNDGILTVAHEASETDGDEVEINTQEIRIDKQGNLQVEEGKEEAAAAQMPPEKKEDQKPAEPAMTLPPPAAPPPPPPPPPIPKQEPQLSPLQGNFTPAPNVPVSQQAAPPQPSAEPVDQLPPLPPPPPPPKVKNDTANAQDTASNNDELEEEPHALLDPMRNVPGIGAPFSADTTQSLDQNAANVDPINNAAPVSGDDGFIGHEKVVTPPPPHTTPLEQLLAAQNAGANLTPPPVQNNSNPATASKGDLTPESARAAVENAYATAPFNPDLNPVANLGAQPMGPEDLHTPPAQDGVPALNLPNNSAPAPQNPPQNNFPPTAPPPMPPPMIPGATPPSTPPPIL